ncbi:hypothetical protein POM88_047487 [Heracleum sosnowskyi]|uniref:Uncharacterized protein n=1 Tax=Heracleum sosnowskyi TaxID=360622 RepID=A0AAD8GTC2_9APIA|nr:hypothetical protein POM88_047487 [Heracleum sosnowskyi]
MYNFGCLNIADIVEDIKTAVKNKVPLVRSLTLNWLKFCIESSNKAILLKLHKEYVPICMECLNDGTPDVRDAAFSALAKALLNIKDSNKDERERLVVRRFKFEEPRLEQVQDLEALPSISRDITEVLDILLRWFVLRLCESNTKCILKVL